MNPVVAVLIIALAILVAFWIVPPFGTFGVQQ